MTEQSGAFFICCRVVVLVLLLSGYFYQSLLGSPWPGRSDKNFCFLAEITHFSYPPTAIDCDSFRSKSSRERTDAIRRSDCIVSFADALFYLPLFSVDGIQAIIVATGNYFEIMHLTIVDPFIQDGSVIFDLGSNIGNHALYWAIRRKARKVYAFEPVPATFAILARNVAINNLSATITPLNMAVGDVRENLTIKRYYPGNIGGTELQKGSTGNIPSIPLDEFEFPEEKVDFVKIDVESFEVNALNGAKGFLKKYRPKYIFIELRERQHKEWATGFLGTLGMKMIRYLAPENYLFERQAE